MASKFSDIAKGPRDILGDDYTSKFSLKAKKNAGPIAVTIETEQSDGGSLTSKVGTKFAYAKFNVDKGQVKADGGKVLETSLKLTKDCKLSFKASKGADLGLDYCSGNLYATGSVDALEMSTLTGSACLLVSQGVKVGGDMKYGLKSSSFGMNLGVSYTHGPVFASVVAANKLATYNVGVIYKVNDELTLASQTTHSSNKMCDVSAIGGSYKAANIGLIKAKVGSNGLVSACLVREIAPKVMLTASGSMSASDVSTFKPGLGITM